MSTAIEGVDAWEVLDSRGRPTLACEVRLAGGATGCVAVPAGASTGRHEARELRDGGARFGGWGVRRAIECVAGPLATRVRGHDAADQAGLDTELAELLSAPAAPGYPGANATLAVSLASCRAAAQAAGEPLFRWIAQQAGITPRLPLPTVNILSGGAHAGRSVDIQDVLALPVGSSGVGEALEWAWRVRASAAELVGRSGGPSALVADEGGLALPLASNRAAVELVAQAVQRAGFALGVEVGLGVDLAASQFLGPAGYRLDCEGRTLSAAGLIEEVRGWVAELGVLSVEDLLGEDDWAGWEAATRALAGHAQLVGDDLFVTNTARLAEGVRRRVATAVLVKPNQAGTLSAALDVVRAARGAGYQVVVSARSGETEDSWLADLAVGWGADQIKVGSLTRGERTAKWNRLLRLEHTGAGELAWSGSGLPCQKPPQESKEET